MNAIRERCRRQEVELTIAVNRAGTDDGATLIERDRAVRDRRALDLGIRSVDRGAFAVRSDYHSLLAMIAMIAAVVTMTAVMSATAIAGPAEAVMPAGRQADARDRECQCQKQFTHDLSPSSPFRMRLPCRTPA